MKLEAVIKKGVFIAKKLYYILDADGSELIKSKGLGRDSHGKSILTFE